MYQEYQSHELSLGVIDSSLSLGAIDYNSGFEAINSSLDLEEAIDLQVIYQKCPQIKL
jgi:hypothetical protein